MPVVSVTSVSVDNVCSNEVSCVRSVSCSEASAVSMSVVVGCQQSVVVRH